MFIPGHEVDILHPDSGKFVTTRPHSLTNLKKSLKNLKITHKICLFIPVIFLDKISSNAAQKIF